MFPQEAERFLSTLREIIPKKLSDSNIAQFEVEWLEDYKEAEEADKARHDEYIEVGGVDIIPTFLLCVFVNVDAQQTC